MSCCQLCGKKYKRMGALRRHLVTCEIIHKNPKNIETPTLDDMFKIMQKLVRENDSLKNKVSALERKVYQKKNKTDIIKWLNENEKINDNLNDWKENIRVEKSDFEYLSNGDFIDGVFKIIERTENIPMKGFTQKNNTIFVYGEQWEKCSITIFTDIVFKIQKRLLDYLREWINDLGDKFYYDTNNSKYMKLSSKILGNGDINDKIVKIYNKLYNKLKVNIRDVIEYQIIF